MSYYSIAPMSAKTTMVVTKIARINEDELQDLVVLASYKNKEAIRSLRKIEDKLIVAIMNGYDCEGALQELLASY